LKANATKVNATNVFFKPLQPWSRVPEMLSLAHVHLVIQKSGAADAVLPSKLTNILACGGHAIVTAEESTELGQIWEKNEGIYRLVEPENSEELAKSLDVLLQKDLVEHNEVARAYAVNHLGFKAIIDEFDKNLSTLTS
jgi:colanic acid biosynthesis glycosyl transferase WcaI